MEQGEPQALVAEDMALQHTLDRKRAALELVAQQPQTKSWLGSCAQSEAGTEKLLEELERHVERDDFADMLQREREAERAEAAGAPPAAPPLPGDEVLQSDWWQPTTDGDTMVSEATGGWVVVEHDTATEALAAFIAAYLVALPEGRSMEPRELQAAVRTALRELRRGRVRRLWDTGRCVYRAVALGYGAFAAYTNPWVAEAVVRGLFTCVRYARMFW